MTEKLIWSNPKVKPSKVLPPATAKVMKLFFIQSTGSYQGQKMMFLLTQKARKLFFRNDWYCVTKQKSP
jgi:hypothetical protein